MSVVAVVVHHFAWVDGGARPNPGHGGYGMWLRLHGEPGIGRGVYMGGPGISNNVAEWAGMRAALEHLLAVLVRDGPVAARNTLVRVHADSQLVVRQLGGRYAVHAAALRPSYEACRTAMQAMQALGATVEIVHVFRAQNRRADALAGLAIERRRNVTHADLPNAIYQPVGPAQSSTPAPTADTS